MHAREPVGAVNLVPIAYSIADELIKMSVESVQPAENTVLVASFVNLNNLEASSGFGRLIAEQIASRFSQRGYRVIELKLRQSSVFIKEGKSSF